MRLSHRNDDRLRDAGDQNGNDGGFAARLVALTDREAQVGFWVAEGKTNSEIGLILDVAVRTVEKHVEHLLQKLGVENRTTAAIRIKDGLAARGATWAYARPAALRPRSRNRPGRCRD